jgi:hypothetical protein
MWQGVFLIILQTFSTGDRIFVPMPDLATCEEAVQETKREFNPFIVACWPPRPTWPGLFRVIIMMSPTDRIVVPMPGASSATCEEAVEEAKREFNPIYAACDPRLPSIGSFRGPIGGLVHREPMMDVLLVLIMSLSGPGLYVPMLDWSTCQEAIVEARNELNPAHIYCTIKVEAKGPPYQPAELPVRYNKDCVPCAERWWEQDKRGPRPW